MKKPATSSATSRIDRPVGTTEQCPRCGAIRTWGVIESRGHRVGFWSECPCVAAGIKTTAQILERAARRRDRIDLGVLAPLAAKPFDVRRLTPSHVYARCLQWLDTALRYDHAPEDSAAALYLYSGTTGTGKSHLAALVAQRAVDRGRYVCVIDEHTYFSQYASLPRDDLDELTDKLARRAWLLVIDDLGRRERATDTLRDAWHVIIDGRHRARGWTIVTSNVAPSSLVARGTLTDATASRLHALTGHRVIGLGGEDQRRVVPSIAEEEAAK